jgi:hypothetical protein
MAAAAFPLVFVGVGGGGVSCHTSLPLTLASSSGKAVDIVPPPPPCAVVRGGRQRSNGGRRRQQRRQWLAVDLLALTGEWR